MNLTTAALSLALFSESPDFLMITKTKESIVSSDFLMITKPTTVVVEEKPKPSPKPSPNNHRKDQAIVKTPIYFVPNKEYYIFNGQYVEISR